MGGTLGPAVGGVVGGTDLWLEAAVVGSESVSEAEWAPAAEVEADEWVKHEAAAAGKVDGLGVQIAGESEFGTQVALVNTKVGGEVEAGNETGVGQVVEAESKALAECAELVAAAFDSDCRLLSAAVAVALASGK